MVLSVGAFVLVVAVVYPYTFSIHTADRARVLIGVFMFGVLGPLLGPSGPVWSIYIVFHNTY